MVATRRPVCIPFKISLSRRVPSTIIICSPIISGKLLAKNRCNLQVATTPTIQMMKIKKEEEEGAQTEVNLLTIQEMSEITV